MFTAIKLGDSVDKQTRRRTVTIQFTEGEQVFVKDFSFAIDTELLEIKKVIKGYLDEINTVVPVLTDGAIDLTDVVKPQPPTPTPAELALADWESNLEKLKRVQELITLGVLTGNETAVVNLRNKVKADFKPAYIA